MLEKLFYVSKKSVKNNHTALVANIKGETKMCNDFCTLADVFAPFELCLLRYFIEY